MRALASKSRRLLTATAMSISLLVPQMSFAQVEEEQPSPLAMAGDMLIARPLGIVITAVGTVIYIVSLPFSLAGGNAKEAGEALVVTPAEATFARCLGCTQSGYKHDTEADTQSQSQTQ